MALHRMTRITLGVPHVDEVSGFYRELGLTEVAPHHFATTDGGEQLHVVAAPHRRLCEIGVGVDHRDDLDRIATQLARAEARVERAGDTLRTTEPVTGTPIVVSVAPRIVQAPGVGQSVNGPGRTARINGRAEAIDRTGPVRPRKLGHVVLGTPDPERTRRFLIDGIGFRLSDEVPGVIAFLRCSTDHHNVAVQLAPVAFMHHSSWEVEDADEIGRGAASLLAADPSRHLWGLGRHYIGSNFFWYLRDPAGNFVEYYSDMDVIADDATWTPGAFGGEHSIAAWGPTLPPAFLAPEDMAALMGAA
jgi:catechol 2,3-dioxygenase-like lactoylglutathione lyase family enzyme